MTRATAYEAKGDFVLGWQKADDSSVQLRVFRTFRDAGDEPESSLLRNSIAAQEMGSDYTEPYDARGVLLTLNLGRRLGAIWRLSGGYVMNKQSVNLLGDPRARRLIDALYEGI